MSGSWRRRTLCAIVILLAALEPVGALEVPIPATRARIDLLGETPDHLSLGFGGFDMIREAARAGKLGPSVAGQVEYRSGAKYAVFGPLLGILANTNGGMVGYAGTYVDGAVSSWMLTPFAAAGGYRRGEGKRLGGVFVFHLGGTVAYRFDNQTRLGITLTHTSNCRVYRENPGAESLLLSYAIPFGARE